MRKRIDGLISPHPLQASLPAVYREDRLIGEFLTAADALLAPLFLCLDNLEAIFDPALAPDDFLNFLATWVAASIDENWPVERQRAFIAQSVMLDRRRGTLAGLTDYIGALTDLPVEATDNGGVAYSRTPGAMPPGSPQPGLVVRILAPDPTVVDVRSVEAAVDALTPPHVPRVVEVVGREAHS